MVKPESQTRQLNPLNHRSHSSERRLTPETEAHANEPLNSNEPTAIAHPLNPKLPSPEEIENAFLNLYSNFVGANLNEKTTWKSENFSQNQENPTPDRKSPPTPSSIAKIHPLRQLKPSPINPEEFR